MSTLRRFRLLLACDRATVRLYAEAFVQLGLARLRLLLPFSRTAPGLGEKSGETGASVPDREGSRAIGSVAAAIGVISRYTPWKSTCLVKAVAGLKMLERRGIDSTLYLGTAKENGRMAAHAWLRSGPYVVSGGDVMNRYVVVETFAKKITTELKKVRP